MGCCCCRGSGANEMLDDGTSGQGSCCCCCGRRGASITFSLLGILFAAALIAGPVYVYNTDQDYAKLFPIFHYGREYLREVDGEFQQPISTGRSARDHQTGLAKPDVVKDTSEDYEYVEVGELGQLTSGKARSPEMTYRLAVHQLIDDAEHYSPHLAFFFFCVGCVNVPINLLLLFGASLRYPCALIPWLAITMIEHIIIGLPIIIFFGLISLYLAVQLNLFVVASALSGIVFISFVLSLSSWFTVYCTYSVIGKYISYDYGTSDSQVAQPLLSSSSMNGGPPPLPPGHPGHYQQQHYYPPHSQSRQLPSAPPHSNGGIYPQLPMA